MTTPDAGTCGYCSHGLLWHGPVGCTFVYGGSWACRCITSLVASA